MSSATAFQAGEPTEVKRCSNSAAGMNSGRSSAAVGQAATEAVVTAIVYLIVADAGINIICQQIRF